MVPTIRLLNKGYIYNDIRTPLQFSTVKYPPFFYIVNSATMILFGENLFSARIITFLCTLSIGLVIFLVIKNKTKNNLLGVLGSLFFFSSYVIVQMATQARVDSLAALFSILGIYFITNYKKKKNFYLAIIFFILSVFTKQTFIAAPIASFIYLLLNDRKNGIKFLSIMIICVVVLALLINFLTQGLFFFHIFKASSGILEFSPIIFSRLHSSLIIIGIGLYYFFKKKDLLGLYFLFSLIILIVQFIRAGAWINYLLETAMLAPILIFLLIEKMNWDVNKLFFVVLIILQIIIFVQKDPRLMTFIIFSNSYTPSVNLVSDNKISSYVANSTENVLTDHATFAIINGKETPPELWSAIELESLGIINNSELIDFIINQNYSMIIYYKSDRIPLIEGLLKYIEKNYKLLDEISWVDQNFVNNTWKIYKR